jgi:integrase
MYKGERYTVACSVLGVPATQEASREAANAWWQAKRAEVDAGIKPARTPAPGEDLAAAVNGGGDFFGRLVEFWRRNKPDADPHALAELDIRQVIANVVRQVIAEGLPAELAGQLPPARVEQVESAVRAIHGERAADPERAIGHLIKEWLTVQEDSVALGDMTAARFSNVKIQMAHVAAYLGADADAGAIDAASVRGFYSHARGKMKAKLAGERKGWSAPYARELFSTFRRWVRWVAEQGVIPLPPNIASRSFLFGDTAKKIKTWEVEDVRRVFGEASDRMRLFMLLMLNCGFTQMDVADLLDEEVEWNAGRITRKRSKTGDKESTPEVCYLLWPETFRLLKKFRSGEKRVLLTETGRTLLRQELRGGKLVRADLIASNYAKLQIRLGFKKPLKQLRKTAASLLGENPQYGRFAQYFLGHAPQSISERHYVRPSQALFDEAVTWLGQQFGFAD